MNQSSWSAPSDNLAQNRLPRLITGLLFVAITLVVIPGISGATAAIPPEYGAGAETGVLQSSINGGESWNVPSKEASPLDLASWTAQSAPAPAGSTSIVFGGTSCPTSTFCEAVGGATGASKVTSAMAEQWNGASWTVQSIGTPADLNDSSLSSVSCPSVNFCIAAGSGRKDLGPFRAFIRTWNGTTWSSQSVVVPRGTERDTLNGVSCASATSCLAVGQYTKGTDDYGLSEKWNGTRWTPHPVPSPAGYPGTELNSLSCASITSCVAVGTANVTAVVGNGPEYEGLVEQWNGATWAIRTSRGVRGVIGNYLNGVSGAYNGSCFAVGYSEARSGRYTVLIERRIGSSWVPLKSPTTSASRYIELLSVSCGSITSCTGVGYINNGSSATTALIEQWNGEIWSVTQATNPSGDVPDELDGVSCSSNNVCVAVGNGGSESTGP